MKLIKLLLRPLKIIVFLLVVLSLVYFRSVIFLPNINQYADDAQMYIEKEFDISIPVHINEALVEAKNNEQIESSKPAVDTCESMDVVSPEVVSDDVTEVAVSESSEKETALTEVVVEEAALKDVVVEENAVDSEKTIADLDLLAQLTDTVNVLNSKVDKLVEVGMESVKSISKASEKPDVSLSVDKNKSVTEDVVIINSEQDNKEIKTNVHLTADAKQMFYMARQTYWRGDALGAEKLYLKLADVEDDNPDIYGELGNVYYAQGKWDAAGKAYYEAAIRLLALNRNNQVNYLLRVIQGLDSDSAEKLKQKISS